jgi:hypothetical protein
MKEGRKEEVEKRRERRPEKRTGHIICAFLFNTGYSKCGVVA